MKNNKNIIRFIVTFIFVFGIFGFIGSFIINNSSLKPQGYKSRTFVIYVCLTIVTFGIVGIVTSVFNLFMIQKKKTILDTLRIKNLHLKIA